MSFLINPYSIYSPPTYTYNTRSIDTSNQASSYTFSGLNIGTASSDRFVVLPIVSRGASSPATITGVTIDGVSAAALASSISGIGVAAIYGLSVSSGTTGTVVVTFSVPSNMINCAIASYSLYGLLSTTPTSTATSTASPLSLNANTLLDSIVIGIASQASNTGVTYSWTGLTERWDELIEASAEGWSGADDLMSSAETPRTLSVSFSSAPTTYQRGCLIVMN